MKNIKINFTSHLYDGVNEQVYHKQSQAQLNKDNNITNVRFYLDDDFYVINMKIDEISIYKRGKDNIDMFFNDANYIMKYYIGENFTVSGKMILFYYNDKYLELEYYLDDKLEVINKIKVEFIEE